MTEMAYLQIARTLFESLFDEPIELDPTTTRHTKTGEFLAYWNDLQQDLRATLPPKQPGDLAYLRKTKYLSNLDPELSTGYEKLSIFRNNLIHGLSTPEPNQFEEKIRLIKSIRSKIQHSGT
jgi:hypothetical protein